MMVMRLERNKCSVRNEYKSLTLECRARIHLNELKQVKENEATDDSYMQTGNMLHAASKDLTLRKHISRFVFETILQR